MTTSTFAARSLALGALLLPQLILPSYALFFSVHSILVSLGHPGEKEQASGISLTRQSAPGRKRAHRQYFLPLTLSAKIFHPFPIYLGGKKNPQISLNCDDLVTPGSKQEKVSRC